MTRFGGFVLVACLAFLMPALAQNSDRILNRDAMPDEPRLTIDDERLENALAALTDDDLQTDRPERRIEIPPERRSPSGLLAFIVSIFSAIGPIIGVLLIVLIALGILAALYFMFGEGLSLRRAERLRPTGQDISVAPDLIPDETAARSLLGDAEALAREGRFAEAVHALLFRSIDLIQKNDASAVKRSFTAREIGQLSALPQSLREGLSPIIRIVERSYFGGRQVDQSQWSQARDAYRSFALGETAS